MQVGEHNTPDTSMGGMTLRVTCTTIRQSSEFLAYAWNTDLHRDVRQSAARQYSGPLVRQYLRIKNAGIVSPWDTSLPTKADSVS